MLRQCLSVAISISIIASTFTAQAGVLRFVPGLGRMSISKLEAAGIKDVRGIKNEAGEMVYEFINEEGAVMRRFVFEHATKEQLKEFAPSKLERLFHVTGTVNDKTHGVRTIVATQIKKFPMEAFSFFVALGAINVSELVFDFNENPVAVSQFLQSQKSILGQVGFSAFMIANGLTSEPLMAMTESSALRQAIPYLGMSVGTIASNITHDIGAHLPGLIECKRTGDLKICDAAWKDWNETSAADKANEWAPGLFAMMASTVVSSTAEWALKAGVMTIVRIVAIQLAFSLTPAGWVIRGGAWAYKVAQIAGFMYLNDLLEAPITFVWHNMADIGPQVALSNRRLGSLMATKLMTNWAPANNDTYAGAQVCTEKQTTNCFRDLDQEIGAFSESMANWREAQLASVLTAHGNWSQYLHAISAQYLAAHHFYSDFIIDLRQKVYNPEAGYIDLMDRKMPLFGVTPKGMTDQLKVLYRKKPDQVYKMQLETLNDVLTAFAQDPSVQASIQTLNPQDLATFKGIYDGLTTRDPDKMGSVLYVLRHLLRKDPSPQPEYISQKLQAVLEKLFTGLGDPNPAMEPGEGYLKLVNNDPLNQMYQNNPFNGWKGIMRTPLATQFLATQMFSGPDVDKGEPTFTMNSSGFPAAFFPPMIRKDGVAKATRREVVKTDSYEQLQSIFSFDFSVNGQASGSLFDFLRQDGVRADVIGDKDSNKFNEWWDGKVEVSFAKAWLTYETRYEDIIHALYKKLYRSEDDFISEIEAKYKQESANYTYSENEANPWLMRALRYATGRVFSGQGNSFANRSPVSNGVLDSLAEERAVYLYILDSALKSSQGKKAAAPKKETQYSTVEAAKGLDKTGEAWTLSLLQEWKKATDLLGKVKEKAVMNKEGTYLVSRLTNQEMKDQIKKLDDMADAFPIKIETVPEFNQKVVKAAIASLKMTQQELLNYVEIINNVSYVETFHSTAIPDQPGVSNGQNRRCANGPRGTTMNAATKVMLAECQQK